jgi:hypothetical protein
MPTDERVEKEAKEELLQIKEDWKKRIEIIRETQVSPPEAKGYRLHIWDVKNRFRDHYGPYISMDLFHESMSTIEAIATEVSIALRQGQENYKIAKHNWWIDWANALGVGVIIGIIVSTIIFVVCRIWLNIEIPFCR